MMDENNLPIVHDAMPPEGDNPSCLECVYSDFQPGERMGRCLYNPPSVIVTPQKIQTLQGDQVVPMLQGVFPPVDSRCFCHMFGPSH